MIERWYQITCNGCGDTEQHPASNEPMASVRKYYRDYGWRSFPGDLDYCRDCVANGVPAEGITDFSA